MKSNKITYYIHKIMNLKMIKNKKYKKIHKHKKKYNKIIYKINNHEI